MFSIEILTTTTRVQYVNQEGDRRGKTRKYVIQAPVVCFFITVDRYRAIYVIKALKDCVAIETLFRRPGTETKVTFTIQRFKNTKDYRAPRLDFIIWTHPNMCQSSGTCVVYAIERGAWTVSTACEECVCERFYGTFSALLWPHMDLWQVGSMLRVLRSGAVQGQRHIWECEATEKPENTHKCHYFYSFQCVIDCCFGFSWWLKTY